MQLLADAANDREILREVGSDNAGDAVGVQILQLASRILAVEAFLKSKKKSKSAEKIISSSNVFLFVQLAKINK